MSTNQSSDVTGPGPAALTAPGGRHRPTRTQPPKLAQLPRVADRRAWAGVIDMPCRSRISSDSGSVAAAEAERIFDNFWTAAG